ncbi:MAG: MauE/DoxX family redox-associated membrane protein [Candidatus Eisenbacteria bacterium]
MSERARGRTIRAAQCITGVLLAWAALGKLGDIPALARDVHNFRLLPAATENAVAMVLPWIELVAALALLLGLRARGAAVVATALMAVLTLAVALATVRGLDIECGCFGTAGAWRVGPAKLAENVAILACAWLGTWPHSERHAGEAPAGRARPA